MADATEISTVLSILQKTYPTLLMHEVHGHDPFRMLVAVVLSQRARDSVTVPTVSTLFTRITTPQDLAALPLEELEAIIRPIGFAHTKALALHALANALITRFAGVVPTTETELLSLPQVGRKTANIIMTMFGTTPQIAVDIHVHRITNRLGWVTTATPEQTEHALTAMIPSSWHAVVNQVFVAHGQTICVPRKPRCRTCPIQTYCVTGRMRLSTAITGDYLYPHE